MVQEVVGCGARVLKEAVIVIPQVLAVLFVHHHIAPDPPLDRRVPHLDLPELLAHFFDARFLAPLQVLLPIQLIQAVLLSLHLLPYT